jgi:hypothetical protein
LFASFDDSCSCKYELGGVEVAAISVLGTFALLQGSPFCLRLLRHSSMKGAVSGVVAAELLLVYSYLPCSLKRRPERGIVGVL